jgi:hypothetical protein
MPGVSGQAVFTGVGHCRHPASELKLNPSQESLAAIQPGDRRYGDPVSGLTRSPK